MSSPPTARASSRPPSSTSIAESLRRWVHGDMGTLTTVRLEVEGMLRNEFADIAHQVRSERDPPTDS